MKPPLLIAASLALVVFALASFAVAQPPAQEPILRLDLGSGVGLDLVLVNAGTFRQGSPSAEALRGEDETEREVTISKPFYIGRQEVTVGQFRRFVEDTGYKTEAEKGTSGGFGWNGQALEQRAGFSWKAPGFPQTDEHPVTIASMPIASAAEEGDATAAASGHRSFANRLPIGQRIGSEWCADIEKSMLHLLADTSLEDLVAPQRDLLPANPLAINKSPTAKGVGARERMVVVAANSIFARPLRLAI